jgi:glycyl-tRNA synthetase beta chain
MPDLLLELLTEEIPARMQGLAARELKRFAEVAFEQVNLSAKTIETFVTPRRLTLAMAGLPKMVAGSIEVRRGPRVGAPEVAVQGFLKSAGIISLDQCEKRSTDKGEFWFALIKRPEVATKEVLPVALEVVITSLTWPKSMRFPAADFRWVRPVVSVISLFDGKVVIPQLDLSKIPVGDTTEGHRFLSKGTIKVRDFKDYRAKLNAAKVILDPSERRKIIADGLATTARKAGYAIKDDPDLLDEVTGLVEWPVILMGSIDDDFMVLPAEVLATSMRKHQKYFTCVDKKGEIQPHFLMVSNMTASDKGKAIIAGNERVLRARLSDAKFFWDQDRKVKLSERARSLDGRMFYDRLGSMWLKTTRLNTLAIKIGLRIGASELAVSRAALSAKADLSTGMVGEFPELQGIIGGYYALAEGESAEVANAIAEHYSPIGPNDRCPTASVSVALALADKIDTLVGFFGIGQIPTGSKDPFALRRAALGVIRLILENNLRLSLTELFREAYQRYIGVVWARDINQTISDLLAFFADRLKVHLKEQGVRHDLIAAVFALGEDDLTRLMKRTAALDAFLKSEDGANLLTAYRRAANILRIEEKKDNKTYSGVPRPDLLQAPEERELDKALNAATVKSASALKSEDFAASMAALASLRAPVDRFFDKVTVNDPDQELRENRLRLLSQIRDTLNLVADFSQIEGG